MRVEVRLYATLADDYPDMRAGEPLTLEFCDHTSLPDLLQTLGIEPQAIHLVIINGRLVRDRGVGLSNGDRVALFPPVGGG